MAQPSINPYGAIDLSALAARSAAAQRAAAAPPAGTGSAGTGSAGTGSVGTGAADGGALVVDVTEASFQTEVLERSQTVPVVVDFWAEWCGPCKQLSPVLERLAQEHAGRFVLAKIDVDAEQRIAAAAAVQSIPTVIAVVAGQALPLFQGALPEAQVRQYVDALLAEAARLGITGTAGGPGGTPDAEPPAPAVDPRYDEAYDAIERGDFDAAAAAYASLLGDAPADADARAGLAQVDLLRRASGADPAEARAAAEAAPDDVAAQLLASDLDVLEGRLEVAFDRLVGVVRRTSGDDRDRARRRLLELFEVVGPDDPRVAPARAALTSALF